MEFREVEDFSDDEVFFGRLTLKEVKKRILMDINEKKISKLVACSKEDCNDNDFKLIETGSEPDMLKHNDLEEFAVENLKSASDPYFNKNMQISKPNILIPELKCQDSFLEIERTITEQCMSPNKSKTNNLDNTLDIVDFILSHTPSQGKEKDIKITSEKKVDCVEGNDYSTEFHAIKGDTVLSKSDNNDEWLYKRSLKDQVDKMVSKSSFATPVKAKVNSTCEQVQLNAPSTINNVKVEPASMLNTPKCIKVECQNVFKTPIIPESEKDARSKKKPSRLRAYEHIASPVATYIKNSPQVPLVKEVHPKKMLPSTSAIPRVVKNVPLYKISNKENVALPPLAYRSAKKTTVINMNKEKMPQSNWAQKLTSSLQKPVVLKHDHRESARKPKPLVLQQESSFADLTLHQADVSVCIQKP